MSYFTKGGVATFTGLTDTPASYVGYKTQVPAVNIAEDGLEFVPMPGAAAPVFPESNLFGPAVKNANWEDLDIGVGQCMALIRCYCAAAKAFFFRQNGDPNSNTVISGGVNGCSNDFAGNISYAWVVTDAAGLVEWRMNIADTVTLTLEAYIRYPTLLPYAIYSGNANVGAGWHTASVGIGEKCLAMLRSKLATGPNDIYVYYRNPAMPEDPTFVYGNCEISGTFGGVGNTKYSWCPTNNSGQIDYMQSAAGTHTMELSTLAILRGVTFVRQQVFAGNSPLAWTALDLPVGQRFVLLQLSAPAPVNGGTLYRFRKTGEALDVGYSGGPHAVQYPTLDTNQTAFVWLITNGYGQIDFISDFARNIIITLLAYI